MITTPLFHQFRNSEFVQFTNDAVTICKEQNVEQLKLTPQVSDLEAKTTALNDVFKITAGSPVTEELVALDHVRDSNIIGIRSYAQSMTYHFLPAKRDAALAILINIDKHGKRIYSFNYPAETSTIKSIINDWTTDTRLAAAIVTLLLTEWMAELKRSNDQFETVFLSRVNDAAHTNDIKFVELRKAAIISFRELTSHIQAWATITPGNTYQPFINALNALINEYNRIVANHSSDNDKPAPPKP